MLMMFWKVEGKEYVKRQNKRQKSRVGVRKEIVRVVINNYNRSKKLEIISFSSTSRFFIGENFS